MTYWNYFFIGMCLIGFFFGLSRGFLRELAAFIGTLVGVVVAPIVVIVLYRWLGSVLQEGENLIFGMGPFGALIFIITAIMLFMVLPISIMAFQFVRQSIEVFLLNLFRNAPNILNNRLLGAGVGAFRYAVYSAVTYLIVSFIWRNL